MSHPCHITWERKLREFGHDPRCEECELFLGSIGKNEMATVALELGVQPLTRFVSSSLESQARSAQEYGYVSQQLPEEWFEAGDALETVRALLSYLEREPATIRLQEPAMPIEHFVSSMTNALRVVEAALEEAHRNNVRFHFTR